MHPILKKSYIFLAILGGIYALFMISLINPTFQRHALYAHKVHTGYWYNVSNPEEFGFAKGQVQPFWLDTPDNERLFCWHVLPYDVYLENESELEKASTNGEVVDGIEGTIGGKLLKRDGKARVVVNFHGNAGHVGQGWRPSTYRSISGIPHTHLLTCDYRGFGFSTLNNPPHLPTEPGLITDSIALVSYLLTTLNHPSTRTVLLGQSLGTGTAAASALYFTDPNSLELPSTITKPTTNIQTPQSFAAIILVAPFPDLPTLLHTYKIAGVIPILSPLRPYQTIQAYLSRQVIDTWPTLPRLQSLLTASKTPVQITLMHSRDDPDISFLESESLYAPLEATLLAEEGVTAEQERRSIHGGERVRRGAFAYRRARDASGERSVELEVVRFGGHNRVVGWSQVGLAVRRAFKKRSFRVGLDVE